MWFYTAATTACKDTILSSLLTSNHSIGGNCYERFGTTAFGTASFTFVHFQHIFTAQWSEDAVKMKSATRLYAYWFRPVF